MHILEILNGYPGETFIREHASAMIHEERLKISWAFWQVSKSRALPPPIDGLHKCVGLLNPNRSSKLDKLFVKAAYLNRPDAYVRRLVHQVRAIKPDVIHFQFAALAIQHYAVAEQLQIPFTFSVRGADIQTYPITIPGYSERLKQVVDKASGIHVVCDHLRNLLFSYCGENEKTSVIRTVINDRWKLVERLPKKGRLVTVGRLHWRKGLPDLLLACHLLKGRGIDFELTIVGDGEQSQMLKFMIRDLGLGSVVTLAGRKTQTEIKKYFYEADLFVLPSLAEGFPNVVGEAMLARLPVLASRASMVHEVFKSDSEFFLVEGSNPESIASGITRFLQMSDEAKCAMTKEAYSTAEIAFCAKRHASTFVEFWRESMKAC